MDVYGRRGRCRGGNFATRRRALNLNCIPCMTEDDFVDAVNYEIRHLSQEYMPWRRHTDGAATKFKTEFETEVNLNIGLKPDFSVQIKRCFKT